MMLGYGSARGDPDLLIGLDHLRFGMDRGSEGMDRSVGSRYGSGLYILTGSQIMYILVLGPTTTGIIITTMVPMGT